MDFDDDGLARKINGNRNASLVSTTEASRDHRHRRPCGPHRSTPNGHEAVLTQVAANGNSVVTAKPLPVPGRPLTETHVLRSETLEMKMRPGGREIESVITKTPGTLEFLPNLPAQHHRILDGNDFVIAYGRKNRVDTFHAVNVKTQTDPTADELTRKNRAVSVTTSRELEARFDPKTGHMSTMQQSGDFAYEEGDRKARAAKATMDADQNVILLDTGARMWDSTGSTTADRIRWTSAPAISWPRATSIPAACPTRTRRRTRRCSPATTPLQATARKMDSRNRNRTDPL